MDQWKLYLFGPPRLERNGQPFAVNLRKALALFVYLAATRQPHSRDALATLFWPEKDQQGARANLRRTLYDLNQLLDGQLLAVEPETIRLPEDAALWLDTEAFQQTLPDHWPANEGAQALDVANFTALTGAVDLYTDDFLAGFTLPDCPAFDDWQFFQREELRNVFARLLQGIVKVYTTQEKFDEALHYARRRLLLDPLEEAVHRQLMRLYAQAGQVASALRQYDECVRILDTELDVPPDEETTALYEAIRAKRFPVLDKKAAPYEQAHLVQKTRRQEDKKTEKQSSQKANVQGAATVETTLPVFSPPPHNLPTQTTPFVGRAQELADILRRINDPACRLLTLIGPGGIGKTRLALEAAQKILDLGFGILDSTSAENNPKSKIKNQKFQDGVFFVALQPVTTPSGLIGAIAEATGFRFYSAVPPQQQLMNFLREKQMLLILDNFEHLLEGVGVIPDLLTAAPDLKLLVTSREALNLQEEWFHPLAGMSLPPLHGKEPHVLATQETDGQAMTTDAVQFFLQSAQRARPGFTLATEQEQVARICRLVDGVPLALELAAAWLKVLSCRKIAEEIAHNLDILTTRHQNIPVRHRSMRAVLEQSWQLLTAAEQGVLERLSIFERGFTQEAARTVTGASLVMLATLAEKALVRVTQDASAHNRYQMHELLRQFVAEKFAAAPVEESATRTQHSAYYLRLIQRYAPLLTGKEQQTALQVLEAEIDNVRAAWRWAVEQGTVDALQETLEPLYNFYQIQSRYLEGKEIFAQAAERLPRVELSEPDSSVLLHLRLLARCGAFCHFLCEYEMAEHYLQKALTLAQQGEEPVELAFVLNFLGQLAMWRGEKARAKQLLSESLAISHKLDDKAGTANALEKLANLIDATLGEYGESQQLARQTLQLSRDLGRPDWIAYALDTLGFVTFCLGDYDDAEAYYRESLDLFETIGDQYGIAMALGGIGLVDWAMGDEKLAEAALYFQRSLLICRTIGHQGQVTGRLAGLARIANDQGEYHQAQELAQEGLTIARELGSPVYLAHLLNCLSETAYVLGDFATAHTYLVEALQLTARTGLFAHLAMVLFHYAALLMAESEADRFVAFQKQTQAAMLFTVVRQHPATWQVYKMRAAQCVAALGLSVSADYYENRSLLDLVEEILRSVEKR